LNALQKAISPGKRDGYCASPLDSAQTQKTEADYTEVLKSAGRKLPQPAQDLA
jgi:hypothetical protein